MPDELQDEMKKYRSSNIPSHLIYEWFNAATNSPVSQNLWSYILPRTLELLTLGKTPSHNLEVVLNRFPTGQKSNWSEAQWQVLDKFQKNFLQTTVALDPAEFGQHTLDDKLCMFANSGWDVDDLFDQVYNLPIHLIIKPLHDDWIAGGVPQIWVSPFWSEPHKIKLKWTAKFLHDRLFEFGMAPDSPKLLADQALELVETMLLYPNDWME